MVLRVVLRAMRPCARMVPITNDPFETYFDLCREQNMPSGLIRANGLHYNMFEQL